LSETNREPPGEASGEPCDRDEARDGDPRESQPRVHDEGRARADGETRAEIVAELRADIVGESRALVCIPVCARRASELRAAVERAAPLADVIELRFDCLEDGAQLEAALRDARALLAARPRPLVFTLRPAEQGGRRRLTAAARLDFWTSLARLLDERRLAPPDFVDLELDLLSDPQARAKLRGLTRDLDKPPADDLDGLPARRTPHSDQTVDHADELSGTPNRATPAATIDITPAATTDSASAPTTDSTAVGLPDSATLICSHHDFAGLPADLPALYERMAATGARVLKIAATARDATDCLPLLALLERARRDGRELIPVAMGASGFLTRVLAPARGALLTYAAADAEHATAPGQATAAELRTLYRVHALGPRTVVTGLVGSPVSHSLSPRLHNAAFAAAGLDAVYLPFEVRDARAFLRRMIHPRTREIDWDARGLSVTAPHKQAVIDCLDTLSASARETGAVNTIVCEGECLRGDNTDAPAALAPLEGVFDVRGARVAVLGAGGAARAVLWALRAAGARATVFARDAARARDAAERFDAEPRRLAGANFAGFDLVVNTTPLGTRGAREAETPADAAQLRGVSAAYDLVYNPPETLFMREARAAGCAAVVGGLQMLLAQAAAQFELWTGRPAPLETMRAAATETMNDER
jgi:3-dehydroquinate dehydratase / shikimate dehydrogenase